MGYHVRVPTESPMNGEEMIDPIIRQSFICPDCGRQTNSKKQLYRHAAQVIVYKDLKNYQMIKFHTL